ncbi:MAG TPA: serine hydrolase domain-containing protein [Gemmatimonadales bacterium]|jgi:serine beta-lactamase-like protein LACTB, mitochondrial|nr:serine hydrolase domain-containing protein [Gemmatimonadales bacterium]
MSCRRARLFLSALVVGWGMVGCAPGSSVQGAAPQSPAAFQSTIAQVRRFILDTMRVLGAPGASISIRKNDRLVWSEGFGSANLEQHVPVTTLTRFRIGSVSKPLTATALGLLSEQGRLDWDAPVQRYVPSFPMKRYPITVRQVAGHLAGIRHYAPGEFENQKHYGSVLEGLTIFQNDSLLFEPGTRYAYSSYGWNLLSAVVEGASGEPFLEFMARHVFGPAGMTHTIADHPDSIIPDRARFYTRSDSVGPVLNAPYVDNSYKWAGGGFLSTTEDLALFAERLLGGRLLQPATVTLLWTTQHTSDGKATGYGIGWSVTLDDHGRRRISHAGGSVGGTANLLIYPAEHLIVALLVNSDRTFVDAVGRYAEPFLATR